MKIFNIIIFLTIFFTGCTRSNNKYYDSGELHSIVKKSWLGSQHSEIIFNPNGDTLEINNFYQDKLDGIRSIYSYDSSYTSKTIYNYKSGILKGEAIEFVNGKKRFVWHYANGKKHGEYTAYNLDGNTKWRGYFHNGELCYVNVYDNEGKLKEVQYRFKYDVDSLISKKSEFKLKLDFLELDPKLKNEKLLYALFSVSKYDTVKLTQKVYDKKIISNEKVEINLGNKVDTGSFYLKVAMPVLVNYKKKHKIYNLEFHIDDDSSAVTNSKKLIGSIKLVW